MNLVDLPGSELRPGERSNGHRRLHQILFASPGSNDYFLKKAGKRRGLFFLGSLTVHRYSRHSRRSGDSQSDCRPPKEPFALVTLIRQHRFSLLYRDSQ